ncbi:hypothetical protein V1512DRAFT_263662 [Lipomyces arxii]|uniref:uncharacterized protein n=1 Tax=Lipomyces arxii TaxID=56418 RepID=UPI0034CFDB48
MKSRDKPGLIDYIDITIDTQIIMAYNNNNYSSNNPFHQNMQNNYAPPSGPPPQGMNPQYQNYNPPPGPPPENYQQYPPPQYQTQQQQYYPPPQQGMGPGGMGPMGAQGMGFGYDANGDAAAIVKATKGFGTDEKALIRILAPRTPSEIDALKLAFDQVKGKSLRQVIEKETSGNFRDCLLQIIAGPLGADVDNVHRAVDGAGTNESMLNDVLLGRTNQELNLLKGTYRQRYGRPLEKDVADDLSMKTLKLFNIVTAATRMEEWIPVDPARVSRDVEDLYRATQDRGSTDEMVVCAILANRSDSHIRELANQYHRRYNKKLVAVIENEFSGHMKKALLYIVKLAVNRPTCCAEMLEDCMAGMGTKDKLLVERIVRYHWDKALMADIKAAYRTVYGRELMVRVRGETSGDYQRLLLAILA